MPHTQDKMTDADKILNYLSQGNSLTFNDCQRMFGSNSIRERIKDLRKKGYNIKTTKEKNPNTGRSHAIYFLVDEQKDSEQESAVRHNNLLTERQPFEKKGQFAWV